MPSPESTFLRDLYAGWLQRLGANPEMDIDTVRDIFEEWHLPTLEAPGVGYENVNAGSTPAIWCTPQGAATDRVLLYFHGGGCVVGDLGRITRPQPLVPDTDAGEIHARSFVGRRF